MFPISLKSHRCHQTTIATLHAKWLGIHFLLWCKHIRNGWYSFFVNLKKISLACLIYYHIVSSNISFIHKSQKKLTTGGFQTKHPMIDLHGNILCPNKMLPRNSPVINLIYLLMPLYTSNSIAILSLLVLSFKADAISWWNLFSPMPCQGRFVGFLFVPLQSARKHDSILTDVFAVHCMHK